MHGVIALQPSANETFVPWTPGSDPTKHPLWSEQVELELEMVQRGADKYRDRVQDAKDKGEMTSLRVFTKKMEEMVPPMAAHIKAWLTMVKRKGGKSIAFGKLNACDPFVASFITLRTLLDTITIEQPQLLSVAKRIGMEMEYQARMEAWQKKAPDVFYGVQNQQRHATARHLRRVNIHQFNKLMRDKLEWVDWAPDERLHVGLRLIDIAVQSTKAFEVTQQYDSLQGTHQAGVATAGDSCRTRAPTTSPSA